MNKSASSTLIVAHFIKKRCSVAGEGGGVITHTEKHLQTPSFFT